MDMEDADAFNDYNYWRLPPPVINENAPATNEAPCRDDVSMDEDEETYSDFNFWRAPPPPSDLRALGLEQQSVATPQRPASPRREYLEVPTPDDVDSDNEDGGDDDDPMTALSGGAGARLLGLLGQLSAHLGSSSRFARAAGLLQEDMMRQRESMMQAQQQAPESPAGSPTRPFAPLAGSTLEQPEVRNSVSSLLNILQVDPPTLALPRPANIEPPAMVLFDPNHALDGGMPEPADSPASPESVAALSPPCKRWCLEHASSPMCTICLEQIDDPDGCLAMPCAKQHVFHKACLLKWLDTRNTCPICRHSMPTAAEEMDEGEEVEPAPPAQPRQAWTEEQEVEPEEASDEWESVEPPTEE